MKSKPGGGSSVSEWHCARHGAQMIPADGGSKAKPKCTWCGSELKLETWTLSRGG